MLLTIVLLNALSVQLHGTYNPLFCIRKEKSCHPQGFLGTLLANVKALQYDFVYNFVIGL